MDERPFGADDYARLARLAGLMTDPGDAERLRVTLAALGVHVDAPESGDDAPSVCGRAPDGPLLPVSLGRPPSEDERRAPFDVSRDPAGFVRVPPVHPRPPSSG